MTSGASFLITQLFFDNGLYFDFVDAARATGIEVPIVPGVIPIASYAQIVRFCELCEASIPQPLARGDGRLGGDQDAEAELGMAYAARQCEELLARRRARDPLLHPQQGAGDACRARRAAGRAAVGAGRVNAGPAPQRGPASAGLK